jgi:ABC-type multidrug transport system permease subunit
MYAGDQYRSLYTVQSHFGALVQIWIGALFGAAQPALLQFPLERVVFIREKAVGTYGSIPYVFAKLLVELPVSFLTAILTMLVSYWTISFKGDFFYLTLSMWALMLASTSTAYILGSVVSSAKVCCCCFLSYEKGVCIKLTFKEIHRPLKNSLR